MRFIAVLFSLVIFLAAVVGFLAVIGPAGMFSIAYLLFASVFALALINIIRGKTYPAKKPAPKLPSKKWLFMVSLLNVLGGIAAFGVYWLVKDHLISARVLTVFATLSLLVLILSGGRIAQPD